MITYLFKVKKNYDKLKYFLLDLGFSFNLIKHLSKELGIVKKNNNPLRMNDRIYKNDIIEILSKEYEANYIIPVQGKLNIVYEDSFMLVVFKEKGIATIPSFSNYENSLANYVTNYVQQYKGDFIYRAINRLDKETSGFVIICKDLITYNLLLKSKIIKEYEVLTTGKLEKQIIDKGILTTKDDKNRNNIKREISNEGKHSITEVVKTKYNKNLNISYGIIRPLTGRTHQIRVHLQSVGTPILGDSLYGTTTANRLYLNCYYTKFYHPIRKKYIVLKNKLFLKTFMELNQAYPVNYQNAKM